MIITKQFDIIINQTIVEPLANNQYVINLGSQVSLFQSYNTLIAARLYDEIRNTPIIYVKKEFDISVTTLKYFKKFANITLTKSQINKILDYNRDKAIFEMKDKLLLVEDICLTKCGLKIKYN